MASLTGKQRRFLRARGHALKPVVWVGKQGLAPNLLTQLDACLTTHELVKIKLLESCPLSVAACAEALAEAGSAAVAQTLGRTILLYRPHPQHPVLELPAGKTSGAAGEPESTGLPGSPGPAGRGTGDGPFQGKQ